MTDSVEAIEAMAWKLETARLIPFCEADELAVSDAAYKLREQAQTIAALRSDLAFVAKWVERAMFDESLNTGDCLRTIAHYPGMPWKTGRWDVDHKPYAAKFYTQFPAALSQENG